MTADLHQYPDPAGADRMDLTAVQYSEAGAQRRLDLLDLSAAARSQAVMAAPGLLVSPAAMIGPGISRERAFVQPGSLFVRAAIPDIRAGWVGAGTGSARLFVRRHRVVFRPARAASVPGRGYLLPAR